MEGNYGGVLFKNRMDDLALDADAAAVDDPDLAKAPLDGLIQIFLDHNRDLLCLEGVKVDGILDWDVVHTESI